MLALSITTQYAIQALKCLARGSCSTQHVTDIARCTGIRKAYLAKVLTTLAQVGLVQSKRGYRGGISLARAADKISLLEIVEAVEGKEWLADCLLGMDDCGVHTNCPAHSFWSAYRRQIIHKFDSLRLADFIPCSTPPKRRCAQRTCAISSGAARHQPKKRHEKRES